MPATDHTRGLKVVRLFAGEVSFADEPSVIDTTLGSCVAVCFFDRETQASAICHAALPFAPVTCSEPFRYVDEAIHYIVGRFGRLGVPRKRLQVKLFGGADVLSMKAPGGQTVGVQNISASTQVLRDLGIPLCARDTGGRQGRRIAFATDTGDVFVRLVPRSALRSVEEAV